MLDLLDIQPPIPSSPPEDVDSPESIDEPSEHSKLMEGNPDSWQGPYIKHLLHQTFHKDPILRAKIKRETWQFKIIQDSAGKHYLYRLTSKFSLLHKCVSKKQGITIPNWIHGGSWGNHFVSHNLANKGQVKVIGSL